MRDALGLLGCLPLVAALAGCPGVTGPSDGAIARYVGDARTPSTSESVPVAKTRAHRVAITVDRAINVPDRDAGPGDSDVYVTLVSDGQRFRTSVVSSPTPTWGDSTVFDVRPGAMLEVTLFDEDSFSSDEKIGIQTIAMPELGEGETTTLEVPFKNGEVGTVFMTLTGIARP